MEVNGNYLLTLRDVMGLAEHANTPMGKVMYNSAVKGNYVLTPTQAEQESTRVSSGAHAKDSGVGLAQAGLPSGKTIDHITFGNESPYSIDGLKAAQGGVWTETQNGKYNYTPSQQTIDKYGDEGLANYFRQYEKGNTVIRGGK